MGLALVIGLLGGCATYEDETNALRSAWAAGNPASAAYDAERAAQDDPDSVDYVIWRLEEGTAKRYADAFVPSNVAFGQANERINEFDQRAKVSLLNETRANFTNQSFLPYRGYSYDRIMMHTYVALNYLQLGQIEAARVSLNRAYQSQREAVDEFASEIEAANTVAREESQAAKRKRQSDQYYDVDRARENAEFQRQMQANYGYLDELTSYADFVNPFTVFVDGLINLTNDLEYNDLERARKSLQRVAAMVPSNDYLIKDLQAAENRLAGQALRETTYVIYETGMAPSREQIQINIPVFLVSRDVPYIGAAFPQLRFNNSYSRYLTAEADGIPYRTQLVCDMDSVIANEFDIRLPLVIVKTLISAGTKAAAQYGLQEAAKGNDAAFLGVLIAGSVYQAAMNNADLRTWLTLPKQFQYCRFPTPPSRQVKLRAAGSGMERTVSLTPGRVNLIYVKSNSLYSPLIIQENTLTPLGPVKTGAAANTAQL